MLERKLLILYFHYCGTIHNTNIPHAEVYEASVVIRELSFQNLTSQFSWRRAKIKGRRKRALYSRYEEDERFVGESVCVFDGEQVVEMSSYDVSLRLKYNNLYDDVCLPIERVLKTVFSGQRESRVSSIFVGQFVKRERRLLALYPVFFFYLLLGWLILLF